MGGVASVRFTAVPRRAVVFATVVWRMTVPGGKSQLPLRVTVPTVSPALVRVPWAWLSARPTTLGTVTTGGHISLFAMPTARLPGAAQTGRVVSGRPSPSLAQATPNAD